MKKVIFSVIMLGASSAAFSQNSAADKAEKNCVNQKMEERSTIHKAAGAIVPNYDAAQRGAFKRDCELERVEKSIQNREREFTNKYTPAKGSKQK
jgi:hypothetical protein